MRILFMGTPDFASSILDKICENTNDTVIGVLTQPDKPRGRGHSLAESAVKVLAKEKGIEVYQPETLKDNAFLPTLKKLDPELIIVAAYGKILPSYVLDYPRLGCINVHGSLLPKYRGAAPIQRAIIDGESVTGITIMKMAEGLDTGDMLLKNAVDITDDDNFETLHDKMVVCARKSIAEAIELIRNGKDVYEKQDDALANYAQKITKEDCLIDFNTDAKALHNRIRGLSPFPLAYSYLDSKMVKFTASTVIDADKENSPDTVGKIIGCDGGIIAVACKKGVFGITGVLPEGKKRMSAADFLRGQQNICGKSFCAQ
ncbi:MAG: methionyl-tRNA formyltransferase [Clostridia bacterium]|nr:methionyl-tRNA formyltransferase [Clostridia bacterium]